MRESKGSSFLILAQARLTQRWLKRSLISVTLPCDSKHSVQLWYPVWFHHPWTLSYWFLCVYKRWSLKRCLVKTVRCGAQNMAFGIHRIWSHNRLCHFLAAWPSSPLSLPHGQVQALVTPFLDFYWSSCLCSLPVWFSQLLLLNNLSSPQSSSFHCPA